MRSEISVAEGTAAEASPFAGSVGVMRPDRLLDIAGDAGADPQTSLSCATGSGKDAAISSSKRLSNLSPIRSSMILDSSSFPAPLRRPSASLASSKLKSSRRSPSSEAPSSESSPKRLHAKMGSRPASPPSPPFSTSALFGLQDNDIIPWLEVEEKLLRVRAPPTPPSASSASLSPPRQNHKNSRSGPDRRRATWRKDVLRDEGS
mmetsp:Transcript_140796/g.366559  ORF Transcript_140796/g.366559 Transcript_140796/m.366559 type:complete len:205 (-) Transcript_140796:1961-2575(-)